MTAPLNSYVAFQRANSYMNILLIISMGNYLSSSEVMHFQLWKD